MATGKNTKGKNANITEQTEQTEQGYDVTTEQTEQAAPATSKQGAAIVLASGERRVDYIRRRWAEGAKRGEIAKELGVSYQVVFAATKPAKTDAGPAEAAEAKSGGGGEGEGGEEDEAAAGAEAA